MVDVQLALEGKVRSNPITLTFTTADTEKAADLGAAYEKVVVVVSATEAADMAGSSTLSLMINDEEYHNELGDLVLVDKPAAGVGIFYVANTGYARNVKVKLSAVPTATVVMTVYGLNRLTKSTAQQIYARTL